jgi:hypothetical protein
MEMSQTQSIDCIPVVAFQQFVNLQKGVQQTV